ITHYGYTAANTYVLYADGQLPSATNCADPANAVAHGNVIDYSATTTNLQTVFSTIGDSATSVAFVFVFSTDHGGTSDGHSYLILWSEQFVSDDDFAGSDYLGSVTTYYREAIVMKQCFSGGFINPLANNKRVIMTSCTATQSSWACDTEGYYGEFAYHWISAVNWANPNGQAVNADGNADGRISMNEAFTYARNHDSMPETPQRSDQGNIGAGTFLDSVCP
ncbi:MAG: C13 family peptidase, partial [Candidatus Bathyarchaeota archaeon]|nr:C13 family peptidase [Candidatus Bathyarchaeota archaeon]